MVQIPTWFMLSVCCPGISSQDLAVATNPIVIAIVQIKCEPVALITTVRPGPMIVLRKKVVRWSTATFFTKGGKIPNLLFPPP
ncbi:hypothetical protein VNO77_04677 [Canavalia gladiata]|uniref:Secreted protein n=1 Tax=Canavalia gladiata TaxID=3824 RepID=A0AAN9MYY5_CANGL